jgi:hypothetical protein
VLSKSDILGRTALRTKEIEIPEWNGSVLIRELTQNERTEVELLVWDGKENKDVMRKLKVNLVILSVIDTEGKRLFDEKDYDELSKKSASAIDRISDAILKLSGITGKETKEIEKNS